ncbi:MAG: histone deacetylase family protein [Rhodobacterales bacterium]|nr:histone deacetylase family protein [Rhodobacterales bacterium]
MPTLLLTHPACLEHDMGEGHPECPDRLRAVMAALESEEFMFLHRREAPLAERRDLERVHPADYVDFVLNRVPERGLARLDPDTALSPGSGEAALRAAGAVCDAVDAVMSGESRNAFCAIRPPGHHAEAAQAMGFCFFNNAAVGAVRARNRHGADRVAIIDFDVHHGNGTQSFADRYADVFYGSSHQSPAYPGTGSSRERGQYGNICNVELAPGSGTEQFRAAYTETILPRLRDFNPELLIISAGFDAHARDPLCQLRVKTEDFGWLTEELVKVANDCCDGKVVSTLEGGYDLSALAASAAVHVRALMHT